MPVPVRGVLGQATKQFLAAAAAHLPSLCLCSNHKKKTQCGPALSSSRIQDTSWALRASEVPTTKSAWRTRVAASPYRADASCSFAMQTCISCGSCRASRRRNSTNSRGDSTPLLSSSAASLDELSQSLCPMSSGSTRFAKETRARCKASLSRNQIAASAELRSWNRAPESLRAPISTTAILKARTIAAGSCDRTARRHA
jgi:hypothetical protein